MSENLAAEPAPSAAKNEPSERVTLARNLGGAGHILAEQAVGIRHGDNKREVIGEILAEMVRPVGIREGPVGDSSGENPLNGARIGFEGECFEFEFYGGAGFHVLEIPIMNKKSRAETGAIDDLTELLASGQELATFLFEQGCGDGAVGRGVDFEGLFAGMSDRKFGQEAQPVATGLRGERGIVLKFSGAEVAGGQSELRGENAVVSFEFGILEDGEELASGDDVAFVNEHIAEDAIDFRTQRQTLGRLENDIAGNVKGERGNEKQKKNSKENDSVERRRLPGHWQFPSSRERVGGRGKQSSDAPSKKEEKDSNGQGVTGDAKLLGEDVVKEEERNGE